MTEALTGSLQASAFQTTRDCTPEEIQHEQNFLHSLNPTKVTQDTPCTDKEITKLKTQFESLAKQTLQTRLEKTPAQHTPKTTLFSRLSHPMPIKAQDCRHIFKKKNKAKLDTHFLTTKNIFRPKHGRKRRRPLLNDWQKLDMTKKEYLAHKEETFGDPDYQMNQSEKNLFHRQIAPHNKLLLTLSNIHQRNSKRQRTERISYKGWVPKKLYTPPSLEEYFFGDECSNCTQEQPSPVQPQPNTSPQMEEPFSFSDNESMVIQRTPEKQNKNKSEEKTTPPPELPPPKFDRTITTFQVLEDNSYTTKNFLKNETPTPPGVTQDTPKCPTKTFKKFSSRHKSRRRRSVRLRQKPKKYYGDTDFDSDDTTEGETENDTALCINLPPTETEDHLQTLFTFKTKSPTRTLTIQTLGK